MMLSASEKMIKENPERLKLIVEMHKKAVDYAMANRPQMVEIAMKALGQQRPSIEMAIPNVELSWKLDDVFVKRAKAYLQLMHDNKQIRQIPNFDRHITTRFVA